MNKDNLMKVWDIAEDLSMSWSAINYRIKSLDIKKYYIKDNNNVGAGACFITSEDAERIYNFQHYRKYADMYKSKEVGDELGISAQAVGAIARFINIQGIRGRKYGQDDSQTMLYTAEQSDAIKAHYYANKKVATYEQASSSNSNEVLQDNRDRSLYTRLTEYGGSLKWDENRDYVGKRYYLKMMRNNQQYSPLAPS